VLIGSSIETAPADPPPMMMKSYTPSLLPWPAGSVAAIGGKPRRGGLCPPHPPPRGNRPLEPGHLGPAVQGAVAPWWGCSRGQGPLDLSEDPAPRARMRTAHPETPA
jgi:hypothetical protein